jgi:phosphoribosylanthranilate isomerase
VKDARFASLAGADAIGLNFYDKSPRYIDLATAEQVLPAIPDKVSKVGVFVNSAADEINEIAGRLNLDYLQLHGDEPPEFLGNFAQYKIIRAFRCGEGGFSSIAEYLKGCQTLGRVPDAVLLDAHCPGQYGGTGQAFDWGSVVQSREVLPDLPLVLAGGLTPFNIIEAIDAARPDAVDVASGVESAPASKDILLIRAFCTNAKKALARLSDEA